MVSAETINHIGCSEFWRDSMGSRTDSHVFQISGIKDQKKKGKLLNGIYKLGGKYIGGSMYREITSHLIVPQVLSREKFLAACAAGKWVLTPEYVWDSVKNGSWLPEEPYELAFFPGAPTTFYPTRKWREKVASGNLDGAFQGWSVLLMIKDPSRRAMFKRILSAGKAKVYHCPPAHTAITHVLAKPVTENSKAHNASCYHISHILLHLFENQCAGMDLHMEDYQPTDAKETDVNLSDLETELRECGINRENQCASVDLHTENDQPTDAKETNVNFSDLETELREYIINREERPRLIFIEFGSYDAPSPPSKVMEADFRYVGSMIECGLFIEALDTIRIDLSPGVLPPARYLVSLIEHAQKGLATPCFLRDLQQVLQSLLWNNPPWLSDRTVREYYTQVLQCPQCKGGLWPFLETAISYCLSSQETCHPITALPQLVTFHRDLVAFVLKLFQGEFYSATLGKPLMPQSSGSLLKQTFWSVWEYSTLMSKTVQQLTKLLVQASVWEKDAVEDPAEKDARDSLRLVENVLDLLCVVVEFWCQNHYRLNPNLVENGLKELAEHIAIISQDVSPVALVEVVVRIHSPRLRLVTADAIFRNICCRNGLTMGDEPLSLKKIVSCYFPTLKSLCGGPQQVYRGGPQPGPETASHSSTSRGTCSGVENGLAKETIPGKENIPRGFNRVNAAGETILHRACKRNQVETVLQILALPGIDINAKDHAGWTPLHEACNHGNTACVEALLRHRPAPHLDTQVDGVSPLHDALNNQHMDIAKMLLEHAGSVLLRQTFRDGRTMLDLLPTAAQREELLRSAQVGDSALEAVGTEVRDLPFLEACSLLLTLLIFTYRREKGLMVHTNPDEKTLSLGCKIVRALETHSLQTVTSNWADQRAVRLVEDAEAVVGMGRGEYLGQVSQAVRECEGENTRLLMDVLEFLKAQGAALVATKT